MSWSFAGVVLSVKQTRPPVTSSGYERIVFRAPGVDGIPVTLENRRMPTVYNLVIQAFNYGEITTLEALAQSGTIGDLEVPRADSGDVWVYEDAFISSGVDYREILGGRLWEVSVEITCPDPRPTWKSTGERVF